MELRQLRYLVALAEELNFTRAAAREHVAQPALSQQIRRLEDEVGLALVERTTRYVALTDAGEVLVVRARRVLAELEAAGTELQAEHAAYGEPGSIPIVGGANGLLVTIINEKFARGFLNPEVYFD